MRRILQWGSYAFAALVGLGLAAGAAAQGATPGLSGSMVGDHGGAYQTWSVTLPASVDASLTLAHWPCDTGDAIGLNVWGPSGRIAQSWASDACTQKASFNTGAGGQAEIQLYNYLHGIGTWWTLSAEGMTLGGGPAAAPAPAIAAAPAAETTTASTTTTVPATSSTAASAPAAPAAAPVAASAAKLNVTDTLFGDSGGAFDSHNLTVQEGKSYTVRMTVGTDWGGTWPGIGLEVWGPNGRVASGKWVSHNVIEATFTSTGDVVYLIQPYNYHHGLTLFYTLETVEGM